MSTLRVEWRATPRDFGRVLLMPHGRPAQMAWETLNRGKAKSIRPQDVGALRTLVPGLTFEVVGETPEGAFTLD